MERKRKSILKSGSVSDSGRRHQKDRLSRDMFQEAVGITIHYIYAFVCEKELSHICPRIPYFFSSFRSNNPFALRARARLRLHHHRPFSTAPQSHDLLHLTTYNLSTNHMVVYTASRQYYCFNELPHSLTMMLDFFN